MRHFQKPTQVKKYKRQVLHTEISK